MNPNIFIKMNIKRGASKIDLNLEPKINKRDDFCKGLFSGIASL